MLAVFSRPRELPTSPRSPCGVKRLRLEPSSLTPEEEEYVQQVLDGLCASLPRRQRCFVSEHYLGGGANAIAFLESLKHGLASDGDVTVFFSGSLENNPEEGVEDAQYVLHQYKRCFEAGLGAEGGALSVADTLRTLRGAWAFVVHDRSRGRVVAARDARGEEPLSWGTTLVSEGVLFASDRALLEGECSDADSFPPGALFVSEDFSTTGHVTSFAADQDAAAQQKALCRVESSTQLRRVPSASQVEAQ